LSGIRIWRAHPELPGTGTSEVLAANKSWRTEEETAGDYAQYQATVLAMNITLARE
jgi:hypothetical protein